MTHSVCRTDGNADDEEAQQLMGVADDRRRPSTGSFDPPGPAGSCLPSAAQHGPTQSDCQVSDLPGVVNTEISQTIELVPIVAVTL